MDINSGLLWRTIDHCTHRTRPNDFGRSIRLVRILFYMKLCPLLSNLRLQSFNVRHHCFDRIRFQKTEITDFVSPPHTVIFERLKYKCDTTCIERLEMNIIPQREVEANTYRHQNMRRLKLMINNTQ